MKNCFADNPPLFDRQKYIENVKQDTGYVPNMYIYTMFIIVYNNTLPCI